MIYEDDAALLTQAIALLAELIDDELCVYDHNGFCQTHYRYHPCVFASAAAFLSRQQ